MVLASNVDLGMLHAVHLSVPPDSTFSGSKISSYELPGNQPIESCFSVAPAMENRLEKAGAMRYIPTETLNDNDAYIILLK